MNTDSETIDRNSQEQHVLTLGAGCFWCVEAVYARIEGIDSAVSGYMGGSKDKAHYYAVAGGRSEHAEVVQLRYDPRFVTDEQVLRLFFELHDPTQLNRQGNDVGPQYRSVIFYHSDEQQQLAKSIIDELERDKKFARPIVTELAEARVFYPAEEEHQDYWEKPSGQSSSYCQYIIPSKLRKLGLNPAPLKSK